MFENQQKNLRYNANKLVLGNEFLPPNGGSIDICTSNPSVNKITINGVEPSGGGGGGDDPLFLANYLAVGYLADPPPANTIYAKCEADRLTLENTNAGAESMAQIQADNFTIQNLSSQTTVKFLATADGSLIETSTGTNNATSESILITDTSPGTQGVNSELTANALILGNDVTNAATIQVGSDLNTRVALSNQLLMFNDGASDIKIGSQDQLTLSRTTLNFTDATSTISIGNVLPLTLSKSTLTFNDPTASIIVGSNNIMTQYLREVTEYRCQSNFTADGLNGPEANTLFSFDTTNFKTYVNGTWDNVTASPLSSITDLKEYIFDMSLTFTSDITGSDGWTPNGSNAGGGGSVGNGYENLKMYCTGIADGNQVPTPSTTHEIVYDGATAVCDNAGLETNGVVDMPKIARDLLNVAGGILTFGTVLSGNEQYADGDTGDIVLSVGSAGTGAKWRYDDPGGAGVFSITHRGELYTTGETITFAKSGSGLTPSSATISTVSTTGTTHATYKLNYPSGVYAGQVYVNISLKRSNNNYKYGSFLA